jgi:hypothetical protein
MVRMGQQTERQTDKGIRMFDKIRKWWAKMMKERITMNFF